MNELGCFTDWSDKNNGNGNNGNSGKNPNKDNDKNNNGNSGNKGNGNKNDSEDNVNVDFGGGGGRFDYDDDDDDDRYDDDDRWNHGKKPDKDKDKDKDKNKKGRWGYLPSDSKVADNVTIKEMNRTVTKSLYSSAGLYSSLNSLALGGEGEEDTAYSKDICNCGWLEGDKYRNFDRKNKFSYQTMSDEAYNNMVQFGGANAPDAEGSPTWAAVTQSGVSLLISYNPNCASTPSEYVKSKSGDGENIKSPGCLNIIYDVNGESSPNVVGQDIGFMTVFFGKNPSLVSPAFSEHLGRGKGTGGEFREFDREGAIKYCASNSSDGGEAIPTAEEYISLVINKHMLPSSLGDVSTNNGVYSQMKNKWYEHDLAGGGTSGYPICIFK